jgi:ABC-type phosphate transport system substrate-binding protein
MCACGPASATPAGSTLFVIATTPALENLVLGWIADHPMPDSSRIQLRTLAPLAVPQAIENLDLAITGGEPPDGAFVTPLYEEGIAVIVHPENDIQSVSLETLEDLIAGRITTWSELNGDNLPVQTVIPFSADETRRHFENIVFLEGKPEPEAILAPTPSAMLQLVGETPGAIGYLPFSYLADEVRAIQVNNVTPTRENVANGRYPLMIPVIAYASEEPPGALREWILSIQTPEATPES